MKWYWVVSVVCLVGSTGLAEYRELEALRQSSRQVLQGYAGRLASEEAKFEGIVKYGAALTAVRDPAQVDVAALTYRRKHYWRAVLEATPRDSSILFSHAHLHAARGETAWADAYFLIGSVTAGKDHRAELDTYRRLRGALKKRAGQEIGKGIAQHDGRDYDKAIASYDKVIGAYPGCALAYYEKGLSYMMMRKDDPQMERKAMAMYGQCRQRDPFHWKAYQGGDPNVIAKLTVYLEKVHPFLSGKQRNKAGLMAFAEGCEAMELYPLAAHTRWKLALIDSDNLQAHMKRFLDLIEKCGVEDAAFFRRQFKFSKE